jgi:hypothetical protein
LVRTSLLKSECLGLLIGSVIDSEEDKGLQKAAKAI